MDEQVCDHDTVLIMIDDGEANTAALPVPSNGRKEGALLLLKATLKAYNLDVYQSYRITPPRIEQVAGLLRDFSGSYLKNINGQAA
jgi:hypothetical protein